MPIFAPMQKIGILGGGQLGRMLLQTAANYPVETFVLENDSECPAAHLCHHFAKGDIKDFDAVYSFGKGLDAITIEIENIKDVPHELGEQIRQKVHVKSDSTMNFSNLKEMVQSITIPCMLIAGAAGFIAARSFAAFKRN